MPQVIRRCARMVRDWCLLQSPEDASRRGAWAEEMERRGSKTTRVTLASYPDDVLIPNSKYSVCNLDVEYVAFTPV
jgi:hypothetical protein